MSFIFLAPLAAGFVFNWASAFTGFFSRRLGVSGGRKASFILRNILGIPVWVIGLVMAFRQRASLLFRTNPATEVPAWILITLGAVLMILALGRLGLRAYRPSVGDTLVESGIFRLIRHPIYSGLLLVFGGGILRRPTIPVIVACLLGFVYVVLQARFEEIDLIQRIPGYREYMRAVPRFFPRFFRHS